MKKKNTALIIFGILTLAICAAMNLWLIPTIESTTQGLRCFDMNYTGYTFEEAKQFLSLLSEDGRSTYLHLQLPLDFVYPVVYCVFFILLIKKAGGKSKAQLALPIALAVFDYTENILSVIMLKSSELARGIAVTASTVTVIKTVLMSATIVLVIILLVKKAKILNKSKKSP